MKFSELYEKYVKDQKTRKLDSGKVNSSIFSVISEYLKKIMELSEPIVWRPAQ